MLSYYGYNWDIAAPYVRQFNRGAVILHCDILAVMGCHYNDARRKVTSLISELKPAN